MKKGLALTLILVMILSILLPMMPTSALDYGMDHSLGSVDASFIGEDSNDESGAAVSIQGDVNGDGYDDILIGAHVDEEGGSGAGQTYLILGKASGWSMGKDLSTADASFIGEDSNDASGRSVAIAGDLNGDGYDDIIIGAPGDEDGGSGAGQTYVIFGKSSGWSKDTDLSNADASFIGEDSNDYAGEVAGVGDVNGDGFDDLLIGAYGDEEAGSEAGQVYLIFGKASGWAMDTDLSNANASFLGENAGDWAGWDVSGVRDVNGDHFDDFVIGAYKNADGGDPNAGQTYLILGKSSGWSMDTDLSNADASFIGEDADDFSGRAVAPAGDVDGDGYDDILIGAWGDEDGGGANAGQCYLILGKSSGWSMDVDLSNADASFWGEVANDRAGHGLYGAGNVNGDGFDDILIGSYGNDAGGNMVGQSYIILGKSSGWAMDTDLSNSDASFIGVETAWDGSGGHVAGMGDINGDGYDDVLIGAWLNDVGGWNSGQSYLVFPDANSNPNAVNSVKAYSDGSYSVEISAADINDTVFVELQGTDGDSNRKDIALASVTCEQSSPMGFRMELMETGLNTGVYQGNFTIKNRTHDKYRWINATDGDIITVTSLKDISENSTLLVGSVEIFPLNDNVTAQEDESYLEHYWVKGYFTPTWSFGSNASWLEWNDTTHNITGIPDNSDVGSYYVCINASMGFDNFDEHNFTLNVTNTPPEINTSDGETAIEDLAYEVDYNSTDDGQGTITWYLETDADDWLSIDSSIGNVSGNPMNEHVGQYYVNVSVDDGNGGWDCSNFTLTVTNTNDGPSITSEDNGTALEDALYSVQYEALDIDVGDVLTWDMETNASPWLDINSGTGLLSGTPTNDDVGLYWVNITVEDAYQASDCSNFSLTVLNTNDPPEITSTPITQATAHYQYAYPVTAEDVDVGDVLSYSLDTRPDGMIINNITGLITWAPRETNKGDNPVVVKVTDGIEPVTQSFIINVEVPVKYEPQVTLLTPLNNTEVNVTNPQFTWSYIDPDSDTVYFDVFLSDNEGKVGFKDPSVKVAEQITSTLYIPPSELSKGSTYYWTVVPFDGENIGHCLNGTWSFKVKEEAVVEKKPSTVLNTPSNKAMIDTLSVQLEWSGADPDSSVIYYDVFLGNNEGMVTALDPSVRVSDDQTDEFYIAQGLIGGIFYYWTVIPNDGTDVGECTSGVWWFKVDENAGENSAPVITSTPIVEALVDKEYRYQANATDVDGDPIQFRLLEKPTDMVIDAQTGLIIWTPTVDQEGNHTVRIRVSDGNLFTVQAFTIEVRKEVVINNEPTITAIIDQTVKVGDTLTYQVAASDIDTGDVLTYSLDGQPPGMDITSTGLITWNPQKDQVGEHTVTVKVSDGKDETSAQFKVTVEKDKKEPTTDPLGSMFPILIVVIIAVVVVVLVLAMTRRGKTREEHLEEEEAPEEPPEEYPDEKQEEPVEDEPEEEDAELEDEIDLDDLEDED